MNTSNLTETAFVNIHGQPVNTGLRVRLPKRESAAPGEYHKGFVVEGIPPGALEAAKVEHEKARASELSAGSKRVRAEWDEAAWLNKAKGKRVRTKAYEIYDAADVCKALAEKAGWLRVTVRAMSKGKAN